MFKHIYLRKLGNWSILQKFIYNKQLMQGWKRYKINIFFHDICLDHHREGQKSQGRPAGGRKLRDDSLPRRESIL